MSKEILRPQGKPAPAAQPEHKPVAWMDRDGNFSDNNDHNCFPIPLYTTANIQSYLEKDNSQPEQEPDVVMHCNSNTWTINNSPPKGSDDVNLYYAPAAPVQPAQEPPPWWAAVEKILEEYGLQAIDFVADFKAAMKDAAQQEPVAFAAEIVADVNGTLSTQWADWWIPDEGDKLYTTPPQRPWVGLT
jgi:hypothetical protein